MSTKGQEKLEQQALQYGIAANAFMAAYGLWASVASNSSVVQFDSLYSTVMLGSILVGKSISRNASRPRDRSYPYGYGGQEADYVMFRCLVLVGVLCFGIFKAVYTIWSYIDGDVPPALELGQIVPYTTIMTIICGLLWVNYRSSWIKLGRQSLILRNEMQNVLADGAYTVVTGIALLASPLLKITPLAVISPIFDSILLIICCVVIGKDALQSFLFNLWQVSGGTSDLAHDKTLQRQVEVICSNHAMALQNLLITQLGRSVLIVAYCNAKHAIQPSQIDNTRHAINQALQSALENPNVASEVILTSEPIFVSSS